MEEREWYLAGACFEQVPAGAGYDGVHEELELIEQAPGHARQGAATGS